MAATTESTAYLKELFRSVPTGAKYQLLRDTLTQIAGEFDITKINSAHVIRWVEEIGSGAVSAEKKRSDIYKHIVGEAAIREKYGVDAATAKDLISGAKTFQSLGKEPTPGSPQNPDVPPLTILSSPSLKWYKDAKTGTFYASYQLPGTTQFVIFETESEQLQALFGNKPPNAQSIDINTLLRRADYHLGGNIAEMEGEGAFEDEVRRATTEAIDRENLPEWMQSDQAAMALLYVKISDERSDEWFYEQVSKLASFKKRYPGLGSLTDMGLSVGEAVGAFTEMEVSLKQLHASAGYHPDAITPDIVGGLLGKGYSINQVQQSYAIWKRMSDNAPALEAFNQVLVANGQKPLTGTDMYAFLAGNAPQEIYDIYEASAITEAAAATGFGGVFDAADAVSLALHTSEDLTPNQAYAQFSQVAAQALRFRHELDVSRFGIDVDDLIDVAFGRAPRSGASVADVGESLARATASAEAMLGRRVQPFTGFSEDGRPQQRSLAGLRVQQ
jgi:hypothetical protein